MPIAEFTIKEIGKKVSIYKNKDGSEKIDYQIKTTADNMVYSQVAQWNGSWKEGDTVSALLIEKIAKTGNKYYQAKSPNAPSFGPRADANVITNKEITEMRQSIDLLMEKVARLEGKAPLPTGPKDEFFGDDPPEGFNDKEDPGI